MNLNKNIVLVGMMGSGKSTIGYLLSKYLKLKFVDVDNTIEEETGLTINNIFQKKGEDYFRNLEEKITLKILKNSKKIIALGGGSFLNKNIRKEILNNHFSVWLSWKHSTIVKRILKSKKRPIAFNLSNNELIELITKRSKIYSRAKFKINCHKLTKTEIIMKIVELYEYN